MNKRLTLYKDDYSDYGWYKILYDIDFVKYEYEETPDILSHREMKELIIEVGGASVTI